MMMTRTAHPRHLLTHNPHPPTNCHSSRTQLQLEMAADKAAVDLVSDLAHGFIWRINHYLRQVAGRNWLPLFMAKKEVFEWLKEGTKTIDIRKGNARHGDTAVFESGANCLEFLIIRKETGPLTEVIRQDNFRSVIPTAKTIEEALSYLRRLYAVNDGVFTAYHLAQPKKL
jgi:ASC-1-like (ASCH) protein